VAELWYYTSEGQPRDPVSREELKQLADSGSLKPTDLVWTEGMPKWVRASSADGIFGEPATSADVAPDSGSRTRRRTAARDEADDRYDYDERPSRRRRERERDRWEDDYVDQPARRRGMGTGAKLGLILGGVFAVLAVGGVILYLALGGGAAQPKEYSVSLNSQRSSSRHIEFKSGASANRTSAQRTSAKHSRATAAGQASHSATAFPLAQVTHLGLPARILRRPYSWLARTWRQLMPSFASCADPALRCHVPRVLSQGRLRDCRSQETWRCESWRPGCHADHASQPNYLNGSAHQVPADTM